MIERFNLDEFKINKNYVIEASAGTGKTYNIVEIVKKLVNDYGYNLDEILIVTYTDKAAGELKDRIRGGLKNQDVDNAPIYTIHSFCQNAIKEFGISASLPLSLNVINDEDLMDFAARYVREGNILKDISSFASVSDFDYNSLIIVLCDALNKYYLNEGYNEDEKIIKLEGMPDEFVDFAKLSSDLKLAKKIDEIFAKNEDIKKNYLVFSSSLEPKAQEFKKELDNCFNSNFNFNGHRFNGKTKWSKDPTINQELSEAFNFFNRFKKFLSDKLSSFKYCYLTFLYLKDFYKKWQIEKEVNKNQTFNDMIRSIRESVLKENSPMKTSLRNKYKYAIIDEFQDTNQMQFDIFSSVFMCEGHNIIVVGDPKQSIYSFQGADIEVYYDAKNKIEMSGGLICNLNKNFRSTSDMVSSCNKLFRHYNFNGTNFFDCDSLKDSDKGGAHKVLYDGKPISAFWIDNDDKLDDIKFAKTAVEMIVDCCCFDANGKTKLQIKDRKDKDYRNVSFKDFAVLARVRSEMSAIENAFRQVGIPFVRYKDQNLFTGKECADWIALLSAINTSDFTGRNRKIFKKVLFTQFVGYSIKYASSEIFETDDNEQIRVVKKWKQIASEGRWEDLFDDIIVESGIIERMTSLSQIQSLGIYKQISNYCVEFLSNNHSIDELINQLEKMADGSSGDDAQNGPIVEKATNFDCVQIMTMHASKGLQFPIVISVGGFKNPRTNRVFTYHKKENGQQKHILGFEKNEQIDFEETEEWKRLFYVGLTRAQFIMVLPNYECFSDGKDFLKESIVSYINDHNDEIKFLTDSNDELLALKGKVKRILEHETIILNSQESKVNQDKVLRQLIAKNNYVSTFKHSYSSISHSSNECIEEDENVIGLEKYDTKSKQIFVEMTNNNHEVLSKSYPRGAKVGSSLHEILEKIDFQNYKDNIEEVIYEAFQNQNLKIDKECLNLTINMIDNVLYAELPIIKGNKSFKDVFTLSTVNKNDRRSEIEFNFNIGNEKLRNYCNGFIDLLFKRDDYFCLLDWKSDCLNDEFLSYSDNEELRKHVNEAYSIQRVLYSYCLIKWLKLYYKDLDEEQIFEKHFGGIYYVFLRGCNKSTGNGIYCQTWQSYDDLKASFEEIVNSRIGGKQNV